jgi:hypothetical protein
MIKTLSDAEAQSLIAEASNNFDPNFFYTNKSSLALDDVQVHFMTLFPAFGKQSEPKVLCGYFDNRNCKPIAKAVHMRKINLRAIPWGYAGGMGETWNKEYSSLPSMMAFDVDENDKPDFKKLYPQYRCYEIHDALDIPRPLVITINPISKNAQYIYEMKWSLEDFVDIEKTKNEYEKIRSELSYLFGADPHFVGHVVRSPMFVAGHHRNNPNARVSRTRIDIDNESLYHRSIWYDPHPYSLAELRQLIVYLQRLLGLKVATLPLPKAKLREFISGEDVIIETKRRKTNVVVSQYHQLAKTPAHQIHEGERNCWLFSRLSSYCRTIAGKYRGNREEFMSIALAKILKDNNSLSSPLAMNEVQATARSVVGYCLSPRYRPLGRTSKEAKFIAENFRWKNHKSIATRASEVGISRSTFYRRLNDIKLMVVKQAMPVSGATRLPLLKHNQLLSYQEAYNPYHLPHYPYDKHSFTESTQQNKDFGSYRRQEPRGPP